MIEVILYSRSDCHLCDVTREYLEELRETIPHRLTVIDVDSSPELKRQYGFNVPVIKVGPYTLTAPIERLDLVVTLKATQNREKQNAEIDAGIASGLINFPEKWTRSDRIVLWLSRHYLAVFNFFVAIYVFLPFIAPVLMKAGVDKPASWIYRAYSVVCHELAFRSWFLFGEQAVYPREASFSKGILTYSEATGLDDGDLWSAREFIGNDALGYKVALCERDIAIYAGLLIFGTGFALTGRRIKPVHWIAWILIGFIPIGLDGLSQLISQPPMSLIPFRESTPILRSVSGFFFGFMTAWFGYPYVEDTMRENRKILEDKYQRSKRSLQRSSDSMNLAS